jgi:drug/metabolite transporter (DMT)-like permease
MLTATWAVWWTLATVTGREVTPAAVPPAAWPGLLGVGVLSTALAIQGFYAGAKRIGAANAALVSTVEPVYTIAIATLFFAETLTPVQIAGGALVISGVLLAQTAPDAPLRSSRRSEVARTGS